MRKTLQIEAADVDNYLLDLVNEKPKLSRLIIESSFSCYTIFIIYYTCDDLDIADPSSIQDACHILTQ